MPISRAYFSVAGPIFVNNPNSSNNSGSSLTIPRLKRLIASGIETPSARLAVFATSANLRIFSLDIPAELVIAVALIASRKLIAPSVAATSCLLNAPKLRPLEAPKASNPRTRFVVSAAFFSAVKAALTAKTLAAYVAYRRTNPPRPCAWFAKSRALAPVAPALPRTRPYSSPDIVCEPAGAAFAATAREPAVPEIVRDSAVFCACFSTSCSFSTLLAVFDALPLSLTFTPMFTFCVAICSPNSKTRNYLKNLGYKFSTILIIS